MSGHYPEQLVLSSWNTSLSPPKGSGHAELDFVLETTNRLLKDSDVVYLCEFDAAAKETSSRLDELTTCYISDENHFYGKAVKSLCHNQGGVHHKSALIYNAQLFEKGDEEDQYFYTPNTGLVPGNYRIGQCVDLRFRASGADIYFFGSHWPGHNETDGRDKKSDAARALYAEIMMKSRSNMVVCMGDYNAEPYELPLVELGATRSLKFAVEHNCLYNPFWHYLAKDDGTLCYPEQGVYKAYGLLYDQILLNKQCLQYYSADAEIVDFKRDLEKGEHKPVMVRLKERSRM